MAVSRCRMVMRKGIASFHDVIWAQLTMIVRHSC